MTIYIYPSPMPGEPLETHEFEGPFDAWLRASVDYDPSEVQPISVGLNSLEVPPSEWGQMVIGPADRVEIRVLPQGGIFSGIGKIISKVFNIFFGWLLPSTNNSRSETPAGKSLETSEAKANVAKLNAVVPEVAGRHIRYPEYLTPPRRYFASPRVQYLEMLLCIGPGSYRVDGGAVRIGNTPLASLPGAEFFIYPPGADVSSNGIHEHWYPCPEVGGTSAGTAGLELSAVPSSAIDPSASSYSFNNRSIVASSNFPEGWGPGTRMGILLRQSYDVGSEPDSPGSESYVNTFAGNWREVAPAEGDILLASGDINGQVKVDRADLSGGVGTLRLSRLNEGEFVPIRDLAPGSIIVAFSVPDRKYQVTSVAGNAASFVAIGNGAEVPSWAGWPNLTVAASSVSFSVDAGTVYGAWAGPFIACPANETTSAVDVDVFFPNGLVKIENDGSLSPHSTGVDVQWRDAGGGGAWASLPLSYSEATMDQIGFSVTLPLAGAIRPEVRMRRVGAASTSTQINDTVQWYGMRSRLKSRLSYPTWTTMAVRIRGLGNIAANSENQVNLVVTRVLPALRSDGSWSAPTPTRDIAAFVKYIATTIGYTDADLDMAELLRLNELWGARGETLDYVFDEGTVKNAIATAFGAGMAQMTIEDGKIRPVRDGVRTQFEQSYSAQNTTGPIVRSFTTARPDDNDGVQVEYVDANDSWTTKTVDCLLPGSLGVRLEKIKLSGVTDRTRAWRTGMRRAREQRYQRWNYTFGTELDAMNSSFGSYVALIPDVPQYGQSALVTELRAQEARTLVTLSEPLIWEPGQSHVLGLRQADGKLIGPFAAIQTAQPNAVIIPIDRASLPLTISLRQEPPHAYFGTLSRWSFPALVKKVSPSSGGNTKVEAVNYDARIYADDDSSIGN